MRSKKKIIIKKNHLLSFRGVFVRVILQGEFAIGPLQFIRGGVRLHAQRVVEARFLDHVCFGKLEEKWVQSVISKPTSNVQQS